jgi:4-diphosphocytidyl-2-C-methyl-D-erythritol kinase
VLKPPASIETRTIFGSPLLLRSTEAAILESSSPNAESAKTMAMLEPGYGRNDLQLAAEAECPQVAQAVAVMHRQFGNARMTGSGSAVYARAGTQSQPVAPMPVDIPPAWAGRMCQSLADHPLVGWAEDVA